MRVVLLTNCLLVLAFGLRAQNESATTDLVLPQGLDSTELEWDIPLARGQRGSLESIRFSATPGLEATFAFAKTRFAARRPLLSIAVTLERTDGSGGELNVTASANYRVTDGVLAARTVSTIEPTTSVFASGEVYKLSVDEDGIYAIDAELLGRLGLSADDISPGEIHLYSKGGAMLPEVVGAPYEPDVQEVSLLELGNGDGKFDGGEKLLFFGQGEDVWYWDAGRTDDFVRRENLYSEVTHYYLKVGGPRDPIATKPAVSAGAYDGTYTSRARWEEDLTNLLYYSQIEYGGGQGSGQDWFGEGFLNNRTIESSEGAFDLGNVVAGSEARVRARVAASPLRPGTTFELTVEGQTLQSDVLRKAIRNDANGAFADIAGVDGIVELSSGTPRVTLAYPGSEETNPGWVDYVEITATSRLRYADGPLFFRSKAHVLPGTYGYRIDGGESLVVWDITDPLRVQAIDGRAVSGAVEFGYTQAAGERPREFVAFDPNGGYPKPAVVSDAPVPNTNLHAASDIDFLIVYGEDMETAAEKLREHRVRRDGFNVLTASMREVAEEFGGGRFDPTAIRALNQMIYARNPGFRFTLLLGDASFDQRGIIASLGRELPDRGNLVPAYQTAASNYEVTAFPTDDYVAMLDEGEGRSQGSFPEGRLDIAVGRIPATNSAQAVAVVDKIMKYDTASALLGNWRLRNVMVADDEDNNLHLRDMDAIAELDDREFPTFNQVKVYADAFEQEVTLGGVRIPRAAAAINRNMFRGNLLTTYLGHGGPNGWAQERILNSPDIAQWNSQTSLPVLVTATCTFTGFDDPTRVVAGEQVLFKPNGGAVASLSTVRPVFTNRNRVLAQKTHELFLDQALNREYRIGELLMQAKTVSTGSDKQNDLKYGLFGDPSMRLAVPRLTVVVTNFDSVAVGSDADTVKIPPLREVQLAGEVQTTEGELAEDFTGEIIATVYDQASTDQTLGQDRGSFVQSFSRQESILFNGKASVTRGKWEAKFMLPKDVSLALGTGKLSLYVKSATGVDGSGVFSRFLVNGLDTPGVRDDTPPILDLYVGSDDFRTGGVVPGDTRLILKLADDTGINVSGAAIGHDLTATIRSLEAVTDETTGPIITRGQGKAFSESIVLNDFYEASIDDYSKGEVDYPLDGLTPGRYMVTARAWDLGNNTAVDSVEFIVSDDDDTALQRVLNYPNPFVDATCFQFEHRAAGLTVDVQVDIYTVSGRLVKSVNETRTANGRRFGNEDCIAWDGTDNYGQRLARGTYLYRIRMRTDDEASSGESDFEKLVILR